MNTRSRGFITIAVGRSWYHRMAANLARSIKRWGNKSQLAVVTDSDDACLCSLFDHIIPARSDLGVGVEQKLSLDLYSPFDQTIFIDADSLAYANVEQLWDMYSLCYGFHVKADAILHPGERHYCVVDLDQCLAFWGISQMAKFNSGVFAFDRSERASRVFALSRRICTNAQQSGLRPFKNAPVNDEPVLAIAMELAGVPAAPWDGGAAMSTTYSPVGGLRKLNVLKGEGRFLKAGTVVDPVIVHFNYEAQDSFVYRREMLRLESANALLGRTRASVLAAVEVSYGRVNEVIHRIGHPVCEIMKTFHRPRL